MSSIFLKAEWRKLAMANYAVDPEVLAPYLPYKTELDLWNGRCYVSLVGFMFLKTRVLGISIPFHTNFEEVNLRFYVRYNDAGTWRRGVVFLSEIVPRHALTFVANTIYGEHYTTLPMKHRWETKDDLFHVAYQWKKKGQWNTFSVSTEPTAVDMAEGSEEEFITEHFWGYTALDTHRTSQYGVEHPRWQVYKTKDYSIDVNFQSIYGAAFAFLKDTTPLSVFLAEGSEIFVKKGKEVRGDETGNS